MKNNKPKRYNNIKEYLIDYAKIRYRKYEERKEKVLHQMIENAKEKEELRKYIDLLVSEKLIIKNRPEQEVLEKLDFYGIRRSLAKKPSVFDQTKEKVEKLRKEVETLHYEIQMYKKMTPAEIWMEELNNIEKELKKDSVFIRKEKPMIFDYLSTFNNEHIQSPPRE